MRRSLYSADPKHAPPLIDIMWDRGALMIEAKKGTLDVARLQTVISQAVKEIQEAVLKGKQNATKQDSDEPGPSPGTKNASAKNIAG